MLDAELVIMRISSVMDHIVIVQIAFSATASYASLELYTHGCTISRQEHTKFRGLLCSNSM